MIMLGDDAISVIIPLISAATDSGMSMRLLFNPAFLAIVRTTGMSMATIAEELMKAPTPPASNMMSTTRRVSLPPPSFITAFTETMRDPGIYQALTDNKDRGDQDHRRVAKARQCFVRCKHVAQHQRQHHEDGHDVDADSPPAKQRDGAD